MSRKKDGWCSDVEENQNQLIKINSNWEGKYEINRNIENTK